MVAIAEMGERSVFGRKKAQQQPRVTIDEVLDRAFEQYDRYWREGGATRPRTFPSGEPFEPDPLLADLRGLIGAAYRCSLTHPSEDRASASFGAVWLAARLVEATIGELGTAKPSIDWVQRIFEGRKGLGFLGLTDAPLSEVALYINKYWDQNGANDAFIRSTDPS